MQTTDKQTTISGAKDASKPANGNTTAPRTLSAKRERGAMTTEPAFRRINLISKQLGESEGGDSVTRVVSAVRSIRGLP